MGSQAQNMWTIFCQFSQIIQQGAGSEVGEPRHKLVLVLEVVALIISHNAGPF